MKLNPRRIVFRAIVLLIVICLFAIVDYWVHGLEGAWRVPEYYFRHKLLYGFLLGLGGLALASRFRSVWLRSLCVAGVVGVLLQTGYLLNGYPLDFVFVFLLIHGAILYVLSIGMFLIFDRYPD